MTKAPRKQSAKASAIWGGRFAAGPSAVMRKINASIDIDQRLYAQDITGSVAHCKMLVTTGILSKADGKAILNGLERVRQEIESGKFKFKEELEDIHMNVEARLADLIGDAAGRLHTARSRNDQVATDLKLWVRDAIDRIDAAIQGLQAALLDKADAHAGAIMPGFTHLQAAQPVTFGHHLLAYVEMFGRDRARLQDARARLNESPLGAAALAGTSFPIDRHQTARELGFDRPAANSLDAVSDRDFALEFLAAGAISAVHLSRLAEELVLWSTPQFGFISLSDAFSTGSSIMPQKRNPDAAELVRAKAGRIIGALNTLLVVMKGLPLAYGKDMQEDKPPVFDTADSLELCLAAMAGMIRDLVVHGERMQDAAGAGFTTATDLADWMVREAGIPFRQAHHIAGRAVKMAEENNCSLADLSPAMLKKIDGRLATDALPSLTVEASVASRDSFGGTSPAKVAAAIKAARRRFL
jgi:argininosuccinate lyase